MKSNKAILIAMLMTGTLMSAPVLAQSQTTVTTTTTSPAPVAVPAAPGNGEVISNTTSRTVRPLAIDGETKEVKPAIQRFIERINMARVSLSMKDPVKAKADLDEAEKHLNFIKQNSKYTEMTKQTVIASGRMTSESESTYNSYYMPLEEGPVVVKSMEKTPSETGKSGINGLAVTSADVVYLNVDLTGQEAPDYIARARSSIKDGNLKEADNLLGEMIKKVTYKEVVDGVPAEMARDNLSLALKFLQDENYTAARYALSHAKEALQKMKGDSRYDAGKSSAAFDKVSQIHDLVMQQTPGTASKARTQILSVQNDLKGM